MSAKTQEPATLPADGFVRLSKILLLIPVSHTTWWSWVKSGRAPRGIKLGAKSTAWRASDIRDLIQRLEQGGGL